MSASTWTPNRSDTLPDWARTELADQSIPLDHVTHWIGSSDGRTIAVAVNNQPIYLTKH